MFRAPVLSCAHYFQAPATQATPIVNWIWRTLAFLYPCESAVKINSLGPVARSLVSANRWLRGIKMYRFPWYLTLVSTNHVSSNPGLGVKTVEHWGRTALQFFTVLERVILSDSSREHFSYWGLTFKKKESVKGCFTTDELFHEDYVITGCLLSTALEYSSARSQ